MNDLMSIAMLGIDPLVKGADGRWRVPPISTTPIPEAEYGSILAGSISGLLREDH